MVFIKRLSLIIALLTSSLSVAYGADSPSNSKALGSLEKSFYREFATLKAQKRILEKRKNESKKFYSSQIGALKKQITNLEGQLVVIGSQSEDLSRQYELAQNSVQSIEDRKNLLENSLSQSVATLNSFRKSDNKVDESFVKFDNAFDLAMIELNRGSSLSRIQGSFFDESGRKVEGELLQLGRVAMFGKSNNAKGGLAPAGEGDLKIIFNDDQFADPTAASIDVFLFDNLNQAIEKSEGKSVLSIIQSGGLIAWVIVFLGLFALVFSVMRFSILKKAAQSNAGLEDQIVEYLDEGKSKEAIELCQSQGSSLGRLLSQCMQFSNVDREQMEDVINEGLLKENLILDRFSTIILVFAAIAPLLGLLGTVTGMISTFDIITEFGTGDPKMLSGGISEALVTTELGLIVAIPTLLLGHLLSAWSKKIKESVESAALRLSFKI